MREVMYLKAETMRLTVTRILLWFLGLITLMLLGVFIFGVDPETLTRIGQWSFFGIWFLFTLALAMLAWLGLARRFLGEARAAASQGTALRQSALIAFLVTAILLSQYYQVLTWWGGLAMMAFLLLAELTYRRFQSLKR